MSHRPISPSTSKKMPAGMPKIGPDIAWDEKTEKEWSFYIFRKLTEPWQLLVVSRFLMEEDINKRLVFEVNKMIDEREKILAAESSRSPSPSSKDSSKTPSPSNSPSASPSPDSRNSPSPMSLNQETTYQPKAKNPKEDGDKTNNRGNKLK